MPLKTPFFSLTPSIYDSACGWTVRNGRLYSRIGCVYPEERARGSILLGETDDHTVEDAVLLVEALNLRFRHWNVRHGCV